MSAGKKPSLLRRIGNSWSMRGKRPGAVDLLTDGFLLTRGRRKTAIRWSGVVRIDGGVRDTLSIDLFFADFRTADTLVTIDEFDDGFRVLESTVFERWPTIRDHWIALQCGPLHQPKYETLWQS